MNIFDESFGGGWKHDLALATIMSITWVGIAWLYHYFPQPVTVLVLGVPVVFVFARWLKMWTEREQGSAPGPFEELESDELV